MNTLQTIGLLVAFVPFFGLITWGTRIIAECSFLRAVVLTLGMFVLAALPPLGLILFMAGSS